MSIWTHVNGCIRIDGIPGLAPTATVEYVRKALGSTVKFESPEGAWNECSVPCGSEGSIQYQIITVGKGLVWLTVPIWGDLRDYEDIEEIKKWFDSIVNNTSIIIRSAVLEVQIEGQESIILQHKEP